jgi:hypothetical protein
MMRADVCAVLQTLVSRCGAQVTCFSPCGSWL